MNTSRHIAGAFAQVFSLDLISKILLGLGGIALIRYMAEREYAEYAVAMAVVMTISQVLTAGIRWTYIVGNDRFGQFESPTSLLTLQILVLAALFMVGVPFAFHFGDLYPVVAALAVATCLAEFSRTVLQQKLRFLSYSLAELTRSGAYLLGLATLIGLSRSQIQTKWVLIIQAIASMMVFAVFLGRTINLPDLLNVSRAMAHLRTIIAGPYRNLFFYAILLSVMSQVDVLALKAMSDSHAVAEYASAFRYYAVLGLALNAVHSVLLPTTSQARDDEEIRQLFKQHRRALGAFAMVVLCLGVTATWFMPWIDLGKYPGAIGVFRILAVSAVVSFAFSPHVNLLFRREEFQYLFLTSIVGLLANIGLNVILIRPFGPIGSALATTCSYALINLMVFARARRSRGLSEAMAKSVVEEIPVSLSS